MSTKTSDGEVKYDVSYLDGDSEKDVPEKWVTVCGAQSLSS